MKLSENFGPKPKLLWLDPKDLIIDNAYQRAAIPTRIKKILQNFNWRDFQPPTIAKVSEKELFVIDGQNRVAAGRLHPKIDKIPCYVLDECDTEAQAKGFVNINMERTSVHPVNIYWAGLIAKDERAITTARAIEAAGVQIAPDSSPTPKPGYIAAVGALYQVISRNGEEILIRTLKVLYQANPKDSRAMTGLLIRSMARLIYESKWVKDEIMLGAMKGINLATLHQEALETKKMIGGSSETIICGILVEEYNREFKRRKKAAD